MSITISKHTELDSTYYDTIDKVQYLNISIYEEPEFDDFISEACDYMNQCKNLHMLEIRMISFNSDGRNLYTKHVRTILHNMPRYVKHLYIYGIDYVIGIVANFINDIEHLSIYTYDNVFDMSPLAIKMESEACKKLISLSVEHRQNDIWICTTNEIASLISSNIRTFEYIHFGVDQVSIKPIIEALGNVISVDIITYPLCKQDYTLLAGLILRSKLKKLSIRTTRFMTVSANCERFINAICIDKNIKTLYVTLPRQHIITIIEKNNTIKDFQATQYSWDDDELSALQLSLKNNMSIINHKLLGTHTTEYNKAIIPILNRNRSCQWSNIHKHMLDFIIIFADYADLNPFTLLGIFDWMDDHWHIVSYGDKHKLITDIIKSIHKVKGISDEEVLFFAEQSEADLGLVVRYLINTY